MSPTKTKSPGRLNWLDFCNSVLASYIKSEMIKMGADNKWFSKSQAIAELFYFQCLTDGQPSQVKTRRIIRKVCGLKPLQNFPRPETITGAKF